MLELIGVDGLTQWDVGRQIKVDKDIDMVHFSNRPYGYSKNVKVTAGVADVPDMFLTSCAPLRVWAYVGDFEKGYTKIEKTYEIKPKNRPEDYIYTPEEIKTWEKLQSEIGDLANLETEAKENLVMAINEAAKSGGESYTLPQATAEALGGVKADSAEAADTQPVRIGTDGKLYTTPSVTDISTKMDANDPVGTGSFSMNRKAGTVVGVNSHAEGSSTTASGSYSHAEGYITTASGSNSHAEGYSTTASGGYSHAEGYRTKASGGSSHAEGNDTTASGDYSHVQGKYNIEDTSDTYADIIGNGTSNTARSNAATVDWTGNAWFAGDVYTGSTSGTNKDDGSKKLATEEYVNNSIAAGGTDISLGLTSAAVGQTIKVKAVDESGKPTAWEAVNMQSGGGGGGYWETVLDTVWEQDVINPTAFDSETGIFTCAEGELNNLELNKKYVFFTQCTVKDVAYNTIINNASVGVTKLSDTTFSIDVTPPTTFVPTNVKFSKGACLAITDINAKKIRLTLDGQFNASNTLYDKPFYGTDVPFFGRNTGYVQIQSAYQAYQQVTAEVESPYRIVGEILCGFNAPSPNASFHFKNNSFCCPLVPYDVPEGHEREYLLTSDGTKIAKLYSTSAPWLFGGANENTAIGNDYLKIISGTKVKLERWVE